MVEGILSVNVMGTKKLQNRLDTMVSRQKIEKALDEGAWKVEEDAKKLVRVDTGLLRASINIIKLIMERRIGSAKDYAAAQEFGRPDMSSYGFTPYLRPALRKNKVYITRKVKEVIEQR